MKGPQRERAPAVHDSATAGYEAILVEMVELLEASRRASARAVNAVMTATYWEIGRRIVECEQRAEGRAAYGERLIERLSRDLRNRFGRGFGVVNRHQMRRFYLTWKGSPILQTASEESDQAASQQALSPTEEREALPSGRAPQFTLP